jgi:hypothetical protein
VRGRRALLRGVSRQEGYDGLSHERDQTESPRARPILQDLNPRGPTAAEVLALIKEDATLKTISTAEAAVAAPGAAHVRRCRRRARGAGAQATPYDELEGFVRGINEFWLQTPTMPRPRRASG